jgi:hypothetical protein
MAILKLLAIGATSVLGMALTAAMPPGPPDDAPPPPHKEKKEKGGPGGELKKTYDLLRRLNAEGKPGGRPEERLKDWSERATRLYRDAIKASEAGEKHQARELGIAAHDLARAVEHARNAAQSGADDDLPPPPGAGGPEGEDERTHRDLRRAHERIVDLGRGDEPDAKFYFDASKDLYNAARRDAEAGRLERAGELARAAEALTHVPEHLARAAEDHPEPPKARRDRPEPPKAKRGRPEPPPKEERDRPRPGGELPPLID